MTSPASPAARTTARAAVAATEADEDEGPRQVRRPGAPARPAAFLLDDARLWPVSCIEAITENQSVTDLDVEVGIGERVLLLLLLVAILLAAVFLLGPFLLVRSTWRQLPDKATTAPIFGILGLAFIALEITMIQRLVQFLGYPTYSLTVTLATLLVSTGVGALGSRRLAGGTRFSTTGKYSSMPSLSSVPSVAQA